VVALGVPVGAVVAFELLLSATSMMTRAAALEQAARHRTG
jgi:hypothetical protein